MEYNCTERWIFRIWLTISVLIIVLSTVQIYHFLTAFAILYVGYKVLAKTFSVGVDPCGRAIFVTGCDTGIGHEVAILLSQRGFTVFAGCLRPEGKGAQVLHQTTGGKVHVIPLDVTLEASVDGAVKKVKKEQPTLGLWAVINNAGIKKVGHVELISIENMKLAMEVNYFGMVRVTKAFLPLIRSSKGRIINITSVKGRMAIQTDVAYVSSKWAAEAFSDCLRREMLRFGVKVIVVEPGNFVAATEIMKGESLDMIEFDMVNAWKSASADVQQAYSWERAQGLVNSIQSASQSGAKTLDRLLTAIDDAVMNEYPSYRYIVAGPWPVDKFCILAKLHQLLPECIMDFILERLI